jgi:hypothetical protein
MPRLLKPSDRALVGGVYAAKLLFEFCVITNGKPDARRLCEERIVLVEAPSAAQAARLAQRQGKAGQHSYRNNDGGQVRFRFVGVLDLCQLGVECASNEVWYELRERVRPMERRRQIVPSLSRLNAVVGEKRMASPSRSAALPNKGMKLTSVEHIGRSQLIPGVRRTISE